MIRNIIIDKIGKFLFKLNYINRSNIIENKELVKIHFTVQMGKTVIHGKTEIGEGTKIFGGVLIHSESHVRIGRYNSINGPNTTIYCSVNNISIGSFCSIARDVTFQEYNHNFKHISTYFMGNILGNVKNKKDIRSNGSIQIGNDVWIGAKATVLSGTTIGDGCVVGANSVVAGNFPPYSILAGSPARVIKSRFSQEIIDKLLEIKWWDWPIEIIKENAIFFQTDINISIIEELANIISHKNIQD